MKNSYNRLLQKPKTAQVSKKNSSISSVLYKEIGDTIKQYKQTKVQTRRDRGSKNSNHNIYDRQNNIRGSNEPTRSRGNSKNIQNQNQHHKQQLAMPFKHLKNNFTNGDSQENNNLLFNQKKSIKNILHGMQQNNEQAKNSQLQKTSKKSFQYKYIIGKGGFGKVWKVQHNKTRNQYAMKQMLKSLVMTKKSVQSVMNQRILLSGLSSPFIVNMHYAFQDRDTLFLVLDLLEGGDLRHHISTKKFSQIQAKFFIGCIILGLQYLHNNKIIHRDIKPENLVLDSRGYVRITDLGIARIKKPNNSCDTSGTPGYMSPEVICRMNHSYVSDFYALGVIAYQLITGKRPHNGVSRNQIRQQIVAKQVLLKAHQVPDDWSEQCIDFVNKLIQRKPEQRMGFHGIQEIKNHPWIKDLNWKKLSTRDIQSPFVPLMKKSDFDQDQQITIQDQQQAQMIQKNSLLLRKPEFQQLFKQYYYQHQKQKPLKQQAIATGAKTPQAQQTRRKHSTGSVLYSNPTHNPSINTPSHQIAHHIHNPSLKSSAGNLKKTNVSTNNSIQISGNVSGSLKSNSKNLDVSCRNSQNNISGLLNKKKQFAGITNNITVRQSRQNILNVTQVEQPNGNSAYMGIQKRQKEKDRPFFRH